MFELRADHLYCVILQRFHLWGLKQVLESFQSIHHLREILCLIYEGFKVALNMYMEQTV